MFLADCSGLIPLWVHHLHDLNRVEAENILNAQRKYLKRRIGDPQIWFQVKELKAIHQAMFGKVWERAGMYRKSVTSIGVNQFNTYTIRRAMFRSFFLDAISS